MDNREQDDSCDDCGQDDGTVTVPSGLCEECRAEREVRHVAGGDLYDPEW